jgi:DNA replication protein DnaC
MAREDCLVCRGTGFKLLPRGDGSRGNMAVPCECGIADRAKQAIDRARIPKRYEHCDFESYVTDLADGKTYTVQQAESLKHAKIVAQAFVRDYPGMEQPGILIMGNSGVGKTHLAIAALKELLARGHSGYFCEYGALLREIQQSYGKDTETTEIRLLAPILSVEVLVIDDLGCIKPSDWVRDTVGYILNARYTDGSRDLSHPRCTIITTNYFDEAESKEVRLPSGKPFVLQKETLADRISERMRSRLFEMCRELKITAPDFRREKTQAGRARA